MKHVSRFHRIGRASVVALAGVAVVVGAGTLFLAKRAHAQAAPGRPVVMAPSFYEPIGSGLPGLHILSVQAWLPAVQRGDTPFALRVDMGDGSVAVLNVPPSPIRSMPMLEVFLTGNDRVGLTVHIRNRDTGEEATAATSSHMISPCWLPGANADGALNPMSVGETFRGSQNTRMADGSVLPIPFQYGLQAATG
ncbi:MAG TPA: hypothetical protein VKT78_19850 [Fimbriimonadaceae bacterium]|nr:hypothetical protein [Fimbriimonadaceae bacterium]